MAKQKVRVFDEESRGTYIVELEEIEPGKGRIVSWKPEKEGEK